MRSSNRSQALIISGVTLMAFLLRAYRLDAQSYWIDEGWTIYYANLSPAQLWHVLQTTKIVPPLYHFTTLYWSRLVGDSEYMLRFCSLVFGVMSVPLTYRLGKALGDRRLGIVAAALMVVAPYQVWHSQDARNYTMLTAASIMSMWGFVNMWQWGGWKWRLMYVIGTEWALMTHYHAVVIIGIQGLFLLLTWRRHWRDYLTWGGTLLIVLLIFGAWLVFGMSLLKSYLNWIPQPTLWASYARSAIAYSVGELVPRPGAIPLALAFVAVYALGLVYANRRTWGIWRGREMVGLLLAYTLAPNLAAWLYGEIRTPVYLERYLIPVQVGYLLTIGMGVLAVADDLRPRLMGDTAQRRLLWAAAASVPLLLLVGISGWVLCHHYTDPAYAKPDWRAVAQTVEDFELEGDAVVITGDGGDRVLRYYYEGDLPIYTDFDTPVPPDDQARQIIARIVARHDRLWYSPYGVDIDATLENWLAANAHPAWQRWIGRKRLDLYATNTTAAARPQAGDTIFSEGWPSEAGAQGAGLRLMEVTVPNQATAAGDVLPITLVWKATGNLEGDTQLSLRLVNSRGDTFAQADWPPLAAAGGTSTWQPGQPVTDRRGLWLPADTPPGAYGLQLVAYQPATGQSLGQPVAIAHVEVAPATIVVPLPSLSIPNSTQQPVGDLTLVGYALPESLQPGEEMWLWLYWQARPGDGSNLATDSIVRLTLAGDGQSATEEFPLIDSVGPLEGWLPGQVRRAVYHLPTSPRLTGKRATVEVALISPPSSQGSQAQMQGVVTLPSIGLRQRSRQFEAPAVSQPAEFRLGSPPVVSLIGYDLPSEPMAPGDTLPVTLYWQADAEMETDYTVFVQVLSLDWQVLAQSDRQPLGGSAPTSTWLAGEILTDPYHLSLPADLPPGDYRVITSMYDPHSGQRLPVSNGGDFAELGEVTVR